MIGEALEMQSEWWITDKSIVFADGDAPDGSTLNHEMYVFQHCVETFCRINNIPYEELAPGDIIAFNTWYNDWTDQKCRQGFGGQNVDELFEEHWANVREELGEKQAEAMRNVMWSSGGTYDGRTYACEYLGWIRVAGNWVQMQTCTKAALKKLTDGLVEIHDHERLTGNWHINVMGNRRIYDDVPTHVLLKASPTALNPYRRNY